MASPPVGSSAPSPSDAWDADASALGPLGTEPTNGSLSHNEPNGQDSGNPDYVRDSSVSQSDLPSAQRGEKQIKPNKVYVGGLPEHTRQEDLQNCFGKIGNIVNIELKVGYGFVEFDNREAAEDSVNKYHNGYFMGNKIRVELSHGGGRTAKYAGEPGSCFKCGQPGHWARECPNHGPSGPQRRHDNYDRDYGGREPRYDYPPRDYRRPPSPVRDYRDLPPPPLRSRDYDDYRRGPPPPDRYGPPPGDIRGRYGPPPPDFYRYGPPPLPPPVGYDRYDRRPPPPPPGYVPPGARSRSPVRFRDDFDRLPPPPRDYPDYRGRPLSPPPGRYNDYAPRLPGGGPPDAQRYR